jgi:hypothetical protein
VKHLIYAISIAVAGLLLGAAAAESSGTAFIRGCGITAHSMPPRWGWGG